MLGLKTASLKKIRNKDWVLSVGYVVFNFSENEVNGLGSLF